MKEMDQAMSKADRIVMSGRSCAGRSIIEILEDELDVVIDRLMTYDESADTAETLSEWKGQAQGISYCIAVFRNVYSPNMPQIKADAMLRYEERNAEPETEDDDE